MFLFQCANIQACLGQTTEANHVFFVHPFWLYLHYYLNNLLQFLSLACVSLGEEEEEEEQEYLVTYKYIS